MSSGAIVLFEPFADNDLRMFGGMDPVCTRDFLVECVAQALFKLTQPLDPPITINPVAGFQVAASLNFQGSDGRCNEKTT